MKSRGLGVRGCRINNECNKSYDIFNFEHLTKIVFLLSKTKSQ
jgi:hypothetical protein